MRFVYIFAGFVLVGFLTWVGVLVVSGIQNWISNRARRGK